MTSVSPSLFIVKAQNVQDAVRLICIAAQRTPIGVRAVGCQQDAVW